MLSCDVCADQFDLLGVGGREDSYSDLLGHAFICSAQFRRGLLRDLLGLEPGPDEEEWQALVRPGVGPIDLACCEGPPVGTDRREDVPDLVFYHPRRALVVAIVNKLFVTEDPDLTERHASITQRHSLADLLGMESPTFHMYYLSLRGARPASPQFQPVSYATLLTRVLAEIPADDSPALAGVLATLRDRLSEYYQRRPPTGEEPLKAHLRYRHRLVFSFRNFEVFAADLFAGYQGDSDVTSNMDCCYIPLHRAWQTAWLPQHDRPPEARAYSAHYELQWNTRLDRLSLYFHVETDPLRASKAPQYLRQGQGAEEAARFQSWRATLYERLASQQQRLAGAGWSLRRSFVALMSAQLPLNDLTTAGEVRERIAGMLSVATPLVDEMVLR